MPPRPFAAFDIDGTILRWQLYHAVADELVKRGHLDDKKYQAVRDARLSWKKRAHQSSYVDYETTLIEVVESGIKSISIGEFEAASSKVINTYKDQVYAYTRDLITDLKDRNYLLFAISASHDSIVKQLADYYGFDEAVGSIYEVKNGKFTGESKILKAERKVDLMKQLADKHRATWQGSIAVGDSEGDIPMLSAVERAIAFNPTKELFAHAKERNWEVVVERKNMVYNLDPDNGKYKLT